jgi:hypothetical protein
MATVELVTERELQPLQSALTDIQKRVAAIEAVRGSEQIAYSRERAAEVASISVAELDKQIGRGALAAKKVGVRVLIPRDALLTWLNNLPCMG